MKTPIEPEALEKYLRRFDVSRDEHDKDVRWQWAVKKCADSDSYILELRADRENNRAEIARLKTRLDKWLNVLTKART